VEAMVAEDHKGGWQAISDPFGQSSVLLAPLETKRVARFGTNPAARQKVARSGAWIALSRFGGRSRHRGNREIVRSTT
jgi:hypothetical protein